MERRPVWNSHGSHGTITQLSLGGTESSFVDLSFGGIESQFAETPVEADNLDGEALSEESIRTWVKIDEKPMLSKSSNPTSLPSSPSRWPELHGSLMKDFRHLTSIRHHSIPSRRDYWTPNSPRFSTVSEYINWMQELKRFLQTSDALLNHAEDAAGITITQSVQATSRYTSIPKDSRLVVPELQTRELIPQSYNDLTTPSTLEITFIWAFTNHVYQRLGQQLTLKTIEKTAGLLPDRLAVSAIAMHHKWQTQISQGVMYFVYKYRNIITELLKLLFHKDQEAIEQEPDEDLMIMADEMSESSGSDADYSSGTEEDLDDDGEYPLEDFTPYRKAVTKDPAFNCIIERLGSELDLPTIDSPAIKGISRRILEKILPLQSKSRGHTSRNFKATFSVEWDIFAFVQEQEYCEHAADVIPKVITLTGTFNEVQATTCEEYLCQTWPTMGCHLLHTIQSALRVYDVAYPFRSSSRYTYADGTQVKASIGESSVIVEAIGTPHSITEIGEQIAWLATALRSSAQDSVITLCHPEILVAEAEPIQSRRAKEPEFEGVFMYKVSVVTEQTKDNLPNISVNGECWQPIFNNPVIVTGYPINPRGSTMSASGLEVSFDMMTALANADYLTTFGDKTVVKGFSTLLIPTGMHDNVIYWHLLANQSDTRISYRDPRIPPGILIQPEHLKGARHILGWCANAQNNIGSPNANHDIKWSALSQCKAGPAWEGLQLSVGIGNCLKVGTTFKKGRKDRSICGFFSNDYESLLLHVGTHHFMLFDVKDRRGWLSDGLPVVSHLVLTSLRRDQKNKSNGIYTHVIQKLKKTTLPTQGARAAVEVLCNRDNRAIELYLAGTTVSIQTIEKTINGETTTEYIKNTTSRQYHFEDRVKEICRLLEIATDTISMATRKDGALKDESKSILSGYNFMDVATREKLTPITAKLQIADCGSGWTDLVDSLEAVTLFGKDFGDLIKPEVGTSTKCCDHCGFGTSLTPGNDQIAVCVDVLNAILEKKGNKETAPWRLIDKLYWHVDGTAFEPCWCTSSKGQGSNRSRVQRLSSKSSFAHITSTNSIKVERNGAVMFGHGEPGPLLSRRHISASGITFSSSDGPQPQARNLPPAMFELSTTQDDSSDTSESQPPHVSSATTTISMRSGTGESDSTNGDFIQQLSAPNVQPTLAGHPTGLTQSGTVPLLNVSPKRPLRMIKNVCVRAWRKFKRSKKSKMELKKAHR
ncbi:hypothetical protein V8C42DRAFT_314623 [Trichoderma barbatum]